MGCFRTHGYLFSYLHRISACEAAAHARRLYCFWRGECGPYRDCCRPHRLSPVRSFVHMSSTKGLIPLSDGGIGVGSPSWNLHHMSRVTGSPLTSVLFIHQPVFPLSEHACLNSPKKLFLPLPPHPQPHAAKELARFPIQYGGALIVTGRHGARQNYP